MGVEFNHTIVWCRDKEKSSAFLTHLLGLPPPIAFAQMLVVRLDNGASLDFFNQDDEIAMQHYAFLLDDTRFDAAFARLKAAGISYWADPGRKRPGELYEHNGGHGLYFQDPDGHLLEIMTRPYELEG